MAGHLVLDSLLFLEEDCFIPQNNKVSIRDGSSSTWTLCKAIMFLTLLDNYSFLFSLLKEQGASLFPRQCPWETL